MSSDLIIRKANHNDVDALVRLLKDLFSIEIDFAVDEAKQRSGLEMIINNEQTSCIMVAEINDRVIGMCSAQITISTAEGGKVAMLEDLVVHDKYRGQGVGRRILSAIEDWSIAQGALRLALLADQGNIPALQFYEVMKWRKTQLICLHKK